RGVQVRGVDGVPDVLGGGVRLHPGCAPAGRVGDIAGATDVAQVGVDAGRVALDQLAGLRPRTALRVGEQLVDDLAVADVGEQDVALQVRRVQGHVVDVPLVRAEVPRPLAPGGQHGVGEVADGGLGGGVPVAEAQ